VRQRGSVSITEPSTDERERAMTPDERPARSRRQRRRPEHPDLGPIETSRTLGSSIDAYLAARGLDKVRVLATLEEAWPSLVGREVDAHCRPARIEGDSFVVVVDHPAWATEVALLGPMILEGVAKVLGTGVLKQVKVHVRT
jgi:predicted nucleic acid-binding Zn ribbon protein